MITTFQAIVLGLVQGLSEFLPVSSSAHLILVPWFFHWSDPGLAYDVALHFGTLVAVVGYFWSEIFILLRAFGQVVTTRKIVTIEQRRAVFLLVASIPGAIAGFALEKKAEAALRSPPLIATALLVLGIILWLTDRMARSDRHLTQITWRDATLVGCAQMFALIPGVSRSGSTITAGRGVGLDRNGAAAFSFLMSIPIIAGAALLKVPEALHQNGLSPQMIAGVLASAISGWFAISVLIKYVSRHSYGLFAWYRVILALVVFAVYFHRG